LPAETHGGTVRCAKCKEPFQAPAGPAERPKEVSAYDWAPDSQTAPPPVSTDDTAAPPRRKKKRKAVNREIADSEADKRRAPAWAVWWGSLVVVSALVAAAFVAMYMNGYRFLTLYSVIWLAFDLPISTIVFAASLFVSNWFGAGIELVNFGSLIPKALLLVLLSSLVGLMPCVGGLVALGVWFIGAMVFFKLEAWETRFLVAFNWVLGWATWLLLIRVLAAFVTKE
jgi:hypothetical protein